MQLSATTLRGNWATLLLPINADDSIDFERLKEEIEYYVEAGVSGIYSNGTAGEFHNQTEDEFYSIQELLSTICLQKAVPFQIGVSHPFPKMTLDRIKKAQFLKPSAYQVTLPDWVITGKEEQMSYLRYLAESAEGIPLVLYNPPHAKQVLGPAELKEICEKVPELIGVKLASGGENWFAEMQWVKNRLSVFVPGHFLATGVSKGVASGAYSNVACLSPKGAQNWWLMMQHDIDAALEMEKRIIQFFEECIVPFKNSGYSNPALDKLLAAAGGWYTIGTRLRWPYRWIRETEVAQVSKRLRQYLPEFF